MKSYGVFVATLLACLAPRQQASAVEIKKDVVFAKRGEQELKLDIALPDGGSMRPALICIHGGGWRAGERSSYHQVIDGAARLGCVALTIDYRLSDAAPWPAQIDDVRAAHRWLIDHAKELKVDAERIAVLGDSAGAHLALMLGLLPSERAEAPRVRGVVNLYGPTDMSSVEKIKHARAPIEALIGGRLEDKLNVLKSASPITHLDRVDPPVLTFHGTEDPVVSFEQAEAFHAALKKLKIPNHLEAMNGAGHELGGDANKNLQLLKDHLEAYLKGSSLPLVFADDFENGAESWRPTDASAWRVVKKDGRHWYALTKKRSAYEPKVRSPYNISWLRDVEVSDFTLDVDFRSTHQPYGHQDLCLFFGRRDASHFYYVHFGRKADAHANSIFLVDDKPRVSIAKQRTDGTDWSRGWHRARIRRESDSGRIEVFFDDMRKPIMVARDKTFTSGQIGIGSFDDTGDFDAIRLRGRKTK